MLAAPLTLLLAAAASLSSAAPLLKRDVGVVAFGAPIVSAKPLNVVDPTADEDVPVSLSANGSLALFGSGESGYTEVQFDFLPSNSSFMAYKPTDELKYGHLAQHGNSSAHVTVNWPGRASGQTPYFSSPFISDDSSQMLQTFQLNTTDGSITFLGAPAWGLPGYTGPFYPEEPAGTGAQLLHLTNSTTAKLILG